MKLKDSGARQEFGTGAVRDISKGKGRCDLLPLDSVSLLMPLCAQGIFRAIEHFKSNKDVTELTYALDTFCEYSNIDIYTCMLEVSKHYEAGAEKYAENNWKKGMPLSCYINSGVRHLLQSLRGDTDEPHDRAFVWNMLGAIWTYQNKPEMDDVEKDIQTRDSEESHMPSSFYRLNPARFERGGVR